MKQRLLTALLLATGLYTYAQSDTVYTKNQLDSIYIQETEKKPKLKLLHAEPLYIDLIRDLGALQGEKEWNVGFGLTDNMDYDAYSALVEYEWAPVDRLGLEVELPFTFHYPMKRMPADSLPFNRLNSVKLAAQYTFLVSDRAKTSMALGYLHEFELTSFRQYKTGEVWEANVYNPFFVAAKRWGQNFHTLLYTGPVINQYRHGKKTHTYYQFNTNFHYLLPGTRNFIGIEFNKQQDGRDFDMTIRPQMRLGLTDNLLVGIVTGIPMKRENERFSSFIRLIYEPKHKHG